MRKGEQAFIDHANQAAKLRSAEAKSEAQHAAQEKIEKDNKALEKKLKA